MNEDAVEPKTTLDRIGRSDLAAVWVVGLPVGLSTALTATAIAFGPDGDWFNFAGGSIDAWTFGPLVMTVIGLLVGVMDGLEKGGVDALHRVARGVWGGVCGAVTGLMLGGVGMFAGLALLIVLGLLGAALGEVF